MSANTEELVTECGLCAKPVTSYWATGGGLLSRPEYVLVADWIFHSACWDEKADKYFAWRGVA